MARTIQHNLAFLSDGGEMGRLMREHDWSSSTLGSPTLWPQSLRSVVGLLLNSKFPMFVAWGDDLAFLYNDPYAEILGAKHPTSLGAKFSNIWAEIWSDISPLIDAAMAGEATFRNDLPLVMNRKGFDEETWFTFSYSPVRDEDGSVAGMFCACTETTERVLSDRRLRQSEARARGVLDGMGEGFVLLDRDFRILEINDEGLRLEQRPRETIVGSLFGEAWPGIEDTEQGRLCARVMAEGVSGSVEAPYRWPDDRGGCFDVNVFPAAEGVALFYRDITDRKEAQAALTDSEERLRLAVDNAEVGFWDVDVVNDALIWPPRVKAMFGISPDVPVTMRDFFDGLHPEDRVATGEAYAAAADPAKRALYDVEYRTVGKEDQVVRWVAAKGRAVFDEDGRCERVTGTAIEITDRKLAEEALHELNATLEARVAEAIAEREKIEEVLRQSQKMEAVGQLTGGIAHDFNNLLTGITGSLERMQVRIAQGRIDEIGRYLTAAQGASQRAAALTHRLLAFSRRQTLDPKPLAVNRLVTDMAELVRRTVGPAIKVEIVGAAGLWPTLTDPNQLENALLNLCINARDAMPDGGRITIETANKWLDDKTARQHDLPAGQYISVCVTDTGTGMSPDVIERAFEPFYTTKPLGAGTGLGLSMIYGFARQSGGQVRIYSEVGTGTTMCIYLPRFIGEAKTDETTHGAANVARGETGETVLVIDDEPTVRMLIMEVLEDSGFLALEAENGPDGLRVLRSGARVDLLITDVGLPGGMNGRQVADAARVLRPHLKVLFITGYAENAVVGNGHLDPHMAILTKPFAMEALSATIGEIMVHR
jgi:PAS domain S-box-containing protein